MWSQYVFHLGETPLNNEDHYKYLGVIFEEHLDFNTCAETLGAAGGSAWTRLSTNLNQLKIWDSTPSVLCIMQVFYQ